MAISLDDMRKAFPTMGFGLYALDPDGLVTLEVYDGDQVFRFAGRSAEEAAARAFPAGLPEAEPVPEPSIFD